MVVYLRKRKQKWNRFCWDVEEMNDDVYFTIGGHYPLIINLSINKLLNSWDPMGIIFQMMRLDPMKGAYSLTMKLVKGYIYCKV